MSDRTIIQPILKPNLSIPNKIPFVGNITSENNLYEIIKNQETKGEYIKKYLAKVNVDAKCTTLLFIDHNDESKIYLYTGSIESGGTHIDEKLNEEMDTGDISIFFSGTILETLLPYNTKVLLFPLVYIDDITDDNGNVDFDKLFIFDEYGRPTNHEQFIVCGGALTNKKNVSRHQYGFVEPTGLFRCAYTGTNSDTNMTETTIYYIDDNGIQQSKTFTKSDNNLLSMIERQLKITGYKTAIEDRTWFKKIFIPSDIRTLLSKSGVGASESFNSATLYDSLFKLGKYIKRYPVLYFNPKYNNKKDAYVFPENREFILMFEKYDGTEMQRIDWSIIKNKIESYQIVNNTNRMASRVTCEAQNVVSNKYIWWPNEGRYLGLTSTIGTLIFENSNASSYTVKLPFKIKDIKYLEVISGAGDRQSGVISKKNIKKTNFKTRIPCLAYTEWALLDADSRGKYAWFEEGSNEIHITDTKECYGDFYGYNDDDDVGIGIRAYFKPIIDGRIEKGNIEDLTDIINQTDAQLDSSLFGCYMQEYSEGQKNYDILFTMCSSYSELMHVGSIIKNDDGEDLIVTDVKYVVNKTNLLVSYVCNYNRPKRSELINASKKIDKQFVDVNTASNRYSNLRIKAKIGISAGGDNLILDRSSVYYVNTPCDLLPGYHGEGVSKITLLKIKCDNVITVDKNNNNIYEKEILAPFLPVSIGTSLIISVQANSNRIFELNGGYVAMKDQTDNGKNNKVLYSDVFGHLKSFSLSVYNYEYTDFLSNLLNWSINVDVCVEENSDNTSVYFNAFLKELRDIINADPITFKQYLSETELISLPDYEIYKSTDEIMNFSFQIDFESTQKNIAICNNFPKYTCLSNDISELEMYIVKIKDFEFDEYTDWIYLKNYNGYTQVNEHLLSDYRTISIQNRNNTCVKLSWSNLALEKGQKYAICVSTKEDVYIYGFESEPDNYIEQIKIRPIIIFTCEEDLEGANSFYLTCTGDKSLISSPPILQ